MLTEQDFIAIEKIIEKLLDPVIRDVGEIKSKLTITVTKELIEKRRSWSEENDMDR